MSPHASQPVIFNFGYCKLVQDLATHVNECSRDADNLAKVEQIQSSLRDYNAAAAGMAPLARRFSLEFTVGGVRAVCSGLRRAHEAGHRRKGRAPVIWRCDTHARYVFLFQKALVVCKQSYTFLYMMNIRDFSVSLLLLSNFNDFRDAVFSKRIF